MAATQTVAQRLALRKSDTEMKPEQERVAIGPELLRPQHGVVTLFGYGINIRVNRGHLILEDGIGSDRFQGRFPRVGHGLERLVVIGADGTVSLAALRWLADQNAAFVMLERDGSVLLTTGPVRSSDAKLRRAQARADESGAALQIARGLIDHKLTGQEQVARDKLHHCTAADRIATLRAAVAEAGTIQAVRLLESQGASVYWSAWRNVPITFPRRDMSRIPDHWRIFDTRQSPLTGSPRLAVNPANAMLNYLYALLESEARLAVAAVGLDPSMGFLHLDAPARDSLACDLMKPVRPEVDTFVLDWISREPLRREWFFEQRDGNCRLMAPLAARLSETASTWRQSVAPYAEWLAQTLWSATSKSGDRAPTTPLTQRHKREAQGAPPLPRSKATPKPERICRICGASVAPGEVHCQSCGLAIATEHILKAAPAGRIAAHSPVAQAQRAETQRRNAAAKRSWDPSTQPLWLTEETFTQRIQPLLPNTRTSDIVAAMGVSWMYASYIRRGKQRPHPRHWVKLAELVGISPEE